MSQPSQPSDARATTEIVRELIHLRSAVGQPSVSPDGTHVACVVSTADVDANLVRTTIWLDGSPLTAGPSDSQPVWSPCGRWLAFVSRRGDERTHSTLHVMPIAGPGEVRMVCSMPDGLGDVAWSPDGALLAFTSRTRDERYSAKDERWQSPRRIERFLSRLNGEDWIFDRPQHVYVVAVNGTGTTRNLTPGEFHFAGVAWLPDSSGLVTGGGGHDTWDTDMVEDLYLVALDGELRRLTDGTGRCAHPAVSPDGHHVAFIGGGDPLVYPTNPAVWVVPLGAGQQRRISTALDRPFNAEAPLWESDTTLLASVEDRGAVHVYRVSIDGTTPVPVVEGQITVHGVSISNGGSVRATVRSNVRRGGELWVERDGGDEQVTHVGVDRLDWDRFAVPCTDGSDEIDVWVMVPPDHDPSATYPVLLNVHGGPFYQYGETYFDEAQIQAAAGFIVVMSNPRGSSGRHTGWGQAIIGPKHPTAPGTGWGTVDVDDVIAALDGALARYPSADPTRVGMLGGSYGGYMATTLAARFGARFRGVCSERSVNNLVTEEFSADIATFFRSEHGPSVVEDPDEYVRMSPAQMAADIHVPMLLIHSELDFRCPIIQAEELWLTLKLLGRDVTFYRFPAENHELSRSGSPVHRTMRAELIIDWFRQRCAAVA